MTEARPALLEDNFTLTEIKITLTEGEFTLTEARPALLEDNFTLTEIKITLIEDEFTLTEARKHWKIIY